MKKLKTGALATLIACAMAACLGLVACSSGPTDEEVIKEGIASELDPIKNLDDATLDEILSEAGSEFAMLESMGIDSKTLVKSYLDGFDYTIDSVEVDGDSAKATLTATCKSFTDASTKAEELAEAFGEQMTDEQLASMTQDDITAKSAKSPCRPSTRRKPSICPSCLRSPKTTTSGPPTPTCSDRC